ncbi:CLUMA_CG015631, isoform A [Clunio marinus]|uniref:CLUMA_CG015631, isoform A n=1 Tax=Clunio marinus TaxID=568069 RepID=A0A1J1IPC2_9DIPT|nr:CLUMA_CG015631, isoform A [Clunio marinus]
MSKSSSSLISTLYNEDIMHSRKINRVFSYRTNAYFGFDPPPDPPKDKLHFHVPKERSKYTPLPRRDSLYEIFSNSENFDQVSNHELTQQTLTQVRMI